MRRPNDHVDHPPTEPARPADSVRAPSIGPVGMLRWMWRQLTSMRVALMLLTLLAVVAVPGSLLPQRPQDPAAVGEYLRENPDLGRWLDRLGMFDVFASVWFSAVYLLLFISLVGCILPRTRAHLTGLRARPPKAPRRFDRFAVQDEAVVSASPEEVVAAARRHLRAPLVGRFLVDDDIEASGARTVSAERGRHRETGNLLFHLALVGILVSVATGHFLHYRGQAIVIEGAGFANAVTDYDSFESGPGFDPTSLVPFTMTLDQFTARFTSDARARDFEAHVTVTEPGTGERDESIRVNSPLTLGGAKIYLMGNGYAPDVTVHDAAGELAFAGPVPFLPEDGVYTSRGVIKVPDVSTGDQIGLTGYLLPTAEVTELGARSVHPQPFEPLLVLTVWVGDLGLDDGVPQNVYRLHTSKMTQVRASDGTPVTIFVEPGETVELPNGLGSLTWEGLPRFAAFDLRHDPALAAVLVSSIAALVGLALSLFTPRRRLWIRVSVEGDQTVVRAAALARSGDIGLRPELDRLMDAVRGLRPTADLAVAATAASSRE